MLFILSGTRESTKGHGKTMNGGYTTESSLPGETLKRRAYSMQTSQHSIARLAKNTLTRQTAQLN